MIKWHDYQHSIMLIRSRIYLQLSIYQEVQATFLCQLSDPSDKHLSFWHMALIHSVTLIVFPKFCRERWWYSMWYSDETTHYNVGMTANEMASFNLYVMYIQWLSLNLLNILSLNVQHYIDRILNDRTIVCEIFLHKKSFYSLTNIYKNHSKVLHEI